MMMMMLMMMMMIIVIEYVTQPSEIIVVMRCILRCQTMRLFEGAPISLFGYIV